MESTVVSVITVISAIFFTVVLHEIAHGFAALLLGDQTAKQAGRLTLNPIKHIDPFGTVFLPGMLAFLQILSTGSIGFMFGWAKPVLVSAKNLKNPKRGMIFVAAAGPAVNFLLAFLTAFVLAAGGQRFFASAIGSGLQYFLFFNLIIGLFNLLPVLPLDGGRILAGFLPQKALRVYAKSERYGLLIIFLAVFLLPYGAGLFHTSFDPFGWVLNRFLPDVAAGFLNFSAYLWHLFGRQVAG